MFRLIFVYLSAIVLLSSCSSYWTRKGCEKIDWFQHAHSVAMDGKRLDEDSKYAECKKVETEISAAEMDRGFKSGMAKYCLPQTALDKGAAGDSFNYDFCESNIAPKLRAQHKEGLSRFCTPDNAYLVGSKGTVYKNQCSKDKEAAFLAKYRKGRQVYLRGEVAKNKSQIKNLENEIAEKKNHRSQLMLRLASLPKVVVVNKDRTYNAATGKYSERSSVNEDPETKRQREELDWQIKEATRAIDTKLSQQGTLRNEIHKLQSEIEGLNQG